MSSDSAIVNGWPRHGPKGDAKPWSPYGLAIIGPRPNNNTTATIVVHLLVIKFEFIYLLMTLNWFTQAIQA
jgi:hypothetical protein